MTRAEIEAAVCATHGDTSPFVISMCVSVVLSQRQMFECVLGRPAPGTVVSDVKRLIERVVAVSSLPDFVDREAPWVY